MIQDETAKKLYNAAIYAATGEGKRTDIGGRYTKEPWLISVSVRNGAPERAQLDVLVCYQKITVFQVTGTLENPELQVLKNGSWQTEMLDKWGPHPDAP